MEEPCSACRAEAEYKTGSSRNSNAIKIMSTFVLSRTVASSPLSRSKVGRPRYLEEHREPRIDRERDKEREESGKPDGVGCSDRKRDTGRYGEILSNGGGFPIGSDESRGRWLDEERGTSWVFTRPKTRSRVLCARSQSIASIL